MVSPSVRAHHPVNFFRSWEKKQSFSLFSLPPGRHCAAFQSFHQLFSACRTSCSKPIGVPATPISELSILAGHLAHSFFVHLNPNVLLHPFHTYLPRL